MRTLPTEEERRRGSTTGSPLDPAQLDQLAINTIRFLSVDAVQKANSGHPGLPLGAAPMAYVLSTRFLRHNPTNPHWFNRDRFVLSAGHGSMLLYSLLYLTGSDVPLEQIKQFRQWGSTTPGHPERGITPGVETTTGPLGDAPDAKPRLILIASGSELGLIVAAGKKIQEQNVAVRLISMPSWELFESQSQEYRDTVLPPSVHARLAVEAGVTQGWHRYVGDRGDVIGVDRFGASAPGPVVMSEFGFTVQNVCQRALALLGREYACV